MPAKVAILPGVARLQWIAAPFIRALRILRGTVPLRELPTLAWRIARVQRFVPCPHSLDEIGELARALAVRRSLAGAVVECGCFKGGSTARLSLLCESFDRRLVVFDSFDGLPEPEPWDAEHQIGRPRAFTRGEYSGSLDEVRANVAKYGRLDRCELVAGWFRDTMPSATPRTIAVAFIDADLVTSTKDALEQIWPRLEPGGIAFVHDTADAKLDAFLAEWSAHRMPSAQSARGARFAWFEK